MKTKNSKNSVDVEETLSLTLTQDTNDSTILNASQTDAENSFSNPIIVEKKKRGRKKIVKPDQHNSSHQTVESDSTNVNDHSNIVIESVGIAISDVDKKEKKVRKARVSKKGQVQNIQQQQEGEKQESECSVLENEKCNDNDDVNTTDKESSTKLVHKKRGRKPRGGKIIHENQIQKNNSPEVPNIILHLKCVLSDLKKSNDISSNVSKIDNYCNDKKLEILCYNDNDQNTAFSSHVSNVTKYENTGTNHTNYFNKDKLKEGEQKEESITTSSQIYDPLTFVSKDIHPTNIKVAPFSFSDKQLTDNHECELDYKNGGNNKDIWKKISQLKLNFHKNDALGIQRSACFWDTCEFDTPPIYIPMSMTKGYGCFCHPECAVAFLMNENIDTSVKFERYCLLNSIYGPVYNYNKSIKPAANPHYLLNKFYGSLTINEYRKLFQSEQVVYIVNKPLTNVLPELYEDNNDFFIGNKIIQNNTIEIKKKVTRNAKSSIINEVFGIK
jgi:hypothetical protein